MKCPNCGAENPDEGKFCLKCGVDLDSAQKKTDALKPLGQFAAQQTQSSIRTILQTPGTTLLTLGVALILVCIIVGGLGHWLAGLALFGISVVLIYFAVELRGHEAKAAAARAVATEVREREIVKVKCRYCGALNPDGATNCGSCGALL